MGDDNRSLPVHLHQCVGCPVEIGEDGVWPDSPGIEHLGGGIRRDDRSLDPVDLARQAWGVAADRDRAAAA